LQHITRIKRSRVDVAKVSNMPTTQSRRNIETPRLPDLHHSEIRLLEPHLLTSFCETLRRLVDGFYVIKISAPSVVRFCYGSSPDVRRQTPATKNMSATNHSQRRRHLTPVDPNASTTSLDGTLSSLVGKNLRRGSPYPGTCGRRPSVHYGLDS
jgi:hypothetical protein